MLKGIVFSKLGGKRGPNKDEEEVDDEEGLRKGPKRFESKGG